MIYVPRGFCRASQVVLALAFLFAVTGCEQTVPAAAEHEDAAGEEKAIPVGAVPAERRNLEESIYGLGRCEPLPEQIAVVTPAVEGRVLRIPVQPGDTVKAGQPIVELDAAIARANLDEKIATRRSLEASLELLRALPRTEERRALELAVDQAKAGVEKADSLVQRLRPLRERNEVSAMPMFEAEVALRQARLQQEAAETQLRIALLGPRAQAVDEARAKIVAAEAAVATARTQLDLHTIRAPIEGVVNSLTCRLGQTVAIGTSLGEIVHAERVFVIVGLAAADARRVRVGQTARITSPDSGDDSQARSASNRDTEPLIGKVTMVGRVADPQTGNLPIRIVVENARARLIVGQIAGATIMVGENQQRLAVPVGAIHDLGEGPVLTVIRNGKTVAQHPQLGVRDSAWVEVLGTDLQPGESVVTEGGYNLPEGKEVRVEKPAGPSSHEAYSGPETDAAPPSASRAGESR